MKQFKVTIAAGIYEPDIGGPAGYAKQLAGSLKKRGIIADIVTFSNVRRYAADEQAGYAVHRVWRRMPKPVRYFNYFLMLMRCARDSDIIYVQSVLAVAALVRWANIFLKKRIIIKVVGDVAWEEARRSHETECSIEEFQENNMKLRIKTRLMRSFERRAVAASDSVIVPSEFLKTIVSRWGADQQKVYVVYNAVDVGALPAMSKEDARKKIGISGSIILSAGRLVPWKGFKMLMKLMPELLKSNTYFRLVVVGEGPERKDLERIRKNLGLEQKVYLVGKKSKEELKLYMNAADMFVLNSGYEGFSHQILEAMACGVPVLASGVGGNNEAITSGSNGLLFPHNDEHYITQFIKVVYEHEDVRKRLIKGGKETVKKYTVDNMVDETVRIFEKN